jgi:hypothetical protein
MSPFGHRVILLQSGGRSLSAYSGLSRVHLLPLQLQPRICSHLMSSITAVPRTPLFSRGPGDPDDHRGGSPSFDGHRSSRASRQCRYRSGRPLHGVTIASARASPPVLNLLRSLDRLPRGTRETAGSPQRASAAGLQNTEQAIASAQAATRRRLERQRAQPGQNEPCRG